MVATVSNRHRFPDQRMLSAIIATHDSENALVPTLGALVSGMMSGLLTEVIVADAGSQDATAEVADIAGCTFMPLPGPAGERLSQAAAAARGSWLLFLSAGDIPGQGWEDACAGFIMGGRENFRAASFRTTGNAAGFLARLCAVFSRPPAGGLLIGKPQYRGLDGHRADAADPATDLVRRIGRRRIATLPCALRRRDT